MIEFPPIPLWILIIDVCIRLLVAVRIIWVRRPVNATLMWLALLAFLPFVGALLYFLIGESKLGVRRLRRYNELTKEFDERATDLWRHRHAETGAEDDAPWASIARFGTAVSGLPPLRGNGVRLIGDAEDFLNSLVADIDKATSHCHLLFYIWQKDTPGSLERVCSALERAAARGVECRVLVDAVGGKYFLRGRAIVRMQEAGVKVVPALPVGLTRMLFERIDLRNHRKIAVIDGKVAYCGSHNLTDRTFSVGWIWKVGRYVDATIRVEGPAAGALGIVFLQDWMLDADEQIESIEKYLPEHRAQSATTGVLQVIPSGPGPAPDAIHQALLTILYSAKEELIMTTPYFVPDEAMSKALQAAARRGVRVTLVMPHSADSWLVAFAGQAHYLDLLEAGVQIMHFRPGLLHSKTVTVDRRYALIGTTNFDARSFWLNFEVTVFVYDDDIASEIRFMQSDYIAKSYEIHLDEWRKRPRWKLFRDNCAQLFGPLL